MPGDIANGPGSRPIPPTRGDLRAALGDGDPGRVLALIAAGADVRYKREHGYDTVTDAVHGRDITRDPRLLDLLAVLIDHGADLSGVTDYHESGLRVLSHLGRFDAVSLLLCAGADVGQLEWSMLHFAAALGTTADLGAALDAGADLEARDWWSRTPWLIALRSGDHDKAKLLLERGADVSACDRFGCPPAVYAVQSRNPVVLRWLVSEGLDVHRPDEYGRTPLSEAVSLDDLEAVEILLASGADVDAGENPFGSPLKSARSREMIVRLLDAGADPAEMWSEGQRLLIGLPAPNEDVLATVTRADYRRAYTRYFGRRNPDLMREPFWVAMTRAGVGAYAATPALHG